MAAKSAHELAKREGVEIPIAGELYDITYSDERDRAANQALMTRTLKDEPHQAAKPMGCSASVPHERTLDHWSTSGVTPRT